MPSKPWRIGPSYQVFLSKMMRSLAKVHRFPNLHVPKYKKYQSQKHHIYSFEKDKN